MASGLRHKLLRITLIFASVYFFLLSIKLLGHSFKLFGKGFAESMLEITANPFVGLLIGIVATSLIQSSSTTTSLVVGLVAGGALNLEGAIPIIMGANIGTTITNTLVSMGHIGNRTEFKRAFSASIVHDLFNVCAVVVLFPIEMLFHPISKCATLLERAFAGVGGLKMFNPLKLIMNPAINLIDRLFEPLPYSSILLMMVSIAVLIGSLTFLIKLIRSMVLDRIEVVINRYLFRNDLMGMVWGVIMTAVVQSSSVTTSIIVPLAGAGLVSLRRIFPYTLGANIGTTITAILAAMATQSEVAVTVAFSHLVFNIFGIAIFYPLRFLPIRIAEFVGDRATSSKRAMLTFVAIYLLLYFIPLAFIFLYWGATGR